jgi:hypothetical protein
MQEMVGHPGSLYLIGNLHWRVLSYVLTHFIMSIVVIVLLLDVSLLSVIESLRD